MALHLRILLILTGLTGLHSVTTVRKVSVKAGGSITIPCLYESKYLNHVKYLCKGQSWSGCTYEVTTKKSQTNKSEKFFLSEDTSQKTFIVTITNLTETDTYFWCNVEINYLIDDGVLFFLSVTRGSSDLHVANQEICGFIGENITISCNSSTTGDIGWCKIGGSCVTGQSGTIDGTSVTIYSRDLKVFNVSMSNLTTKSGGWYYCSKGDLQMPVHITVTNKPNSTCATTTQDPTQIRPLIDKKILIIPLSLLIVIVLVALFIWFMWRKHKQNELESSAITTAEAEVTCCSVKHNRETSAQPPTPHASQRPDAETDKDVLYSSVVQIKPHPVKSRPDAKTDMDVLYSSVKSAGAQDIDASYSMLALSHQNT